MTQEAFNLYAVGYREPSHVSASYPYLPVEGLDDKAQDGIYDPWLRHMMQLLGPGPEGSR